MPPTDGKTSRGRSQPVEAALAASGAQQGTAGGWRRWVDWIAHLGAGPPGPAAPPSAQELARAARVLSLRTRRESAGLLSGVYASAFRGGGMEFDESRPYVPGDDPRHFDWNAMARTGEPFAKHFREERDLTLLICVDVSRSMAFGPHGRNKAALAARIGALLATAADRAGDRVGLVTFDEHVRERLPAGRGTPHTWQLIRRLVAATSRPAGGTRLAAAGEGALTLSSERCTSVLISDFRGPEPPQAAGDPGASLRELARRHDVVSIVLCDPHEVELPRAGRVRVRDPENPHRSLALDTSARRVRARHARAFQAWREGLEQALRHGGSDVVWLRTDRDPLRPLVLYFQRRASGQGRAA